MLAENMKKAKEILNQVISYLPEIIQKYLSQYSDSVYVISNGYQLKQTYVFIHPFFIMESPFGDPLNGLFAYDIHVVITISTDAGSVKRIGKLFIAIDVKDEKVFIMLPFTGTRGLELKFSEIPTSESS